MGDSCGILDKFFEDIITLLFEVLKEEEAQPVKD